MKYDEKKTSYVMEGEVVHGKALGRTVGMPTINLKVEKGELPPSGVYASTMTIQGQTYQGLTNVGRRPSVDEKNEKTVETYLLHFSKDVYGEYVQLRIGEFIRPIQKFDGIEAVKKQVEKDIKKIDIF